MLQTDMTASILGQERDAIIQSVHLHITYNTYVSFMYYHLYIILPLFIVEAHYQRAKGLNVLTLHVP